MPRATELATPAPHALQVVAGILRDAAGRILVTERVADGAFAGLWEFPGGKMRAGESALAALRRELREEIGVEVRHCERFLRLRHDYADRRVAIEFFIVSDWLHEPTGREGQALRWSLPEGIDAVSLLPADEPVLRALCGR